MDKIRRISGQNPVVPQLRDAPVEEGGGNYCQTPLDIFMEIYEDAVSYVRKSPERFFRMGSPDPIELATHVLGDALLAGATETCTIRVGDWWLVGSDVDWLAADKQYTMQRLFARIVALPEAGPNSMRAEILLSAFTEAVITAGGDDCLTIRGDVPEDAEIWCVMKSRTHFKRLVAFRLNSHKAGDKNV